MYICVYVYIYIYIYNIHVYTVHTYNMQLYYIWCTNPSSYLLCVLVHHTAL